MTSLSMPSLLAKKMTSLSTVSVMAVVGKQEEDGLLAAEVLAEEFDGFWLMEFVKTRSLKNWGIK